MTLQDHANKINDLPTTTRDIVLDALRVRAMDFVSERLDADGVSDQAADIYREIRCFAGDQEAFNPDCYEPILGGPLV